MTTATSMLNTQPRDSQVDENNNPKSKECLLIKPSRELNFLHLNNKYAAELSLQNKKDEFVLFKIRTTAAKNYVVLPTIGLLPPRGAISIKIFMPKTEQLKERINDKFLIQAFTYKGKDLGDDTLVMNQVFDHFYKSLSSKEFQNSKLRVYFESHTVIEEEASEDGTPAPARRTSKAANTKLEESAADPNTFANFTSPKQQPNQVSTPMSPEPQVLVPRRESKRLTPNGLTQTLSEEKYDTFRAQNDQSNGDSFRNTTPESYFTPSDKLKLSEQEIHSARFRDLNHEKPKSFEQDALSSTSYRESENLKVVRSLRDEFEKDLKGSSLTNITNLKKEQSGYNSNDVSIYTEFSDVRSDVSVSEQLSAYKYRLQLLEHKFSEQKAQMEKLMQEKEKYQKESDTFKRGSLSFASTTDQTKPENSDKHQMNIWHLIVLCVVCMILGALFR